MTMSPVLRGHFDHLVVKGRQTILWVALEPEEGERLREAMEPDPHRAKSIPIAFVIGTPAASLESLLAPGHASGLASPAEATDARSIVREEADPAADLGAMVSEISRLTGDLRQASDGVNATFLVGRDDAISHRDRIAAQLRKAQDRFNSVLRTWSSGGRP